MGIRVNKAMAILNIGTETVVEYLKSKPGLEPTKELNPNSKLTDAQYDALAKEFAPDMSVKEIANKLFQKKSKKEKEAEKYKSYASTIDYPQKEGSISNEVEKEKDDNSIVPVIEPLQEDKRDSEVVTVLLSKLRYKTNCITYKSGTSKFALRKTGISRYINSQKSSPNINNISTKILLNHSILTFQFVDASVLSYLLDLSSRLEKFEKHLKNVENKKEQQQESKEKQEKVKKTIQHIHHKIQFSGLKFDVGFVTITYKKKRYFYRNYNIRNFDNILKQIYSRVSKVRMNAIKASLINVEINIETSTFTFIDFDLYKYVKNLKDSFLPDKHIHHKIQFSMLRFGNGFVSIIYKKTRYFYRNYNIRNFDNVLKQIYGRIPKARMNAIRTSLINVEIDIKAGTFIFIDFDLCKYVKNLKDNFLPDKKNSEERKETSSPTVMPQKISNVLKTITLGYDNIEFFDGYFLLWIFQNGQKDTSISPLRKDSPHSFSRLRYVHKRLSDQFPTDIRVKYDNKRVLSLSKEYDLRDYIRILDDHKDDKYSEWWIEEMNSQKESLEFCRAKTNAKREAALKNEFFDVLSCLQNNQKLIPAYEVDHGKKEDAFIFSVDMTKNRHAIIFENIKPARTTELFVVKTENYESCLHRIFDYFTNYSIPTKRRSLRFGKNIAGLFNAESYCYIDHKSIEQWLNCLTEQLETNRPTADIDFISGLRIPNNPSIRSIHDTTISIKNIHNELVIKLFAMLSEKYGKQNVGTEIRVGDRRIDTVVKKDNCFDIYEIKSATSPLDCIIEASGQLLLYAYKYCRDKIGKMYIVGPSEPTKEVDQYLEMLRNKHSLPLYYINV